MKRHHALGAVAVLALGIACGHDATKPDPTAAPAFTGAVISFTTPHADDGAIALTLHGPDLGTITAASAGYIVYTRASSGEVRVIVVGDIAAGRLLTVTVGPGHVLSDYSASVDQVASRAEDLRTDLNTYGLTLAPQ